MIKGWILGTDKLLRQFTESPHYMQDALYKTVDRLALRLLRKVKQDKLSGQVLRVGKRGGGLRRGINYRVERSGKAVYGTVGTNKVYGRAHEYGFKGAVSVRAHLREVKQAFGKPLKEAKQVYVRAHARQMNLPERSFLRSALREMQPGLNKELCDAVHSALPIGKLLG